ncbi:YihY/virulence factor BrkB family protein [Chitinasiproducens palmae]|uniref:Membrane protein n=2 Tax=Chitinasiproducens palmae TaxID=1770053 RepID=A0A1H2PMF1_9BURK|nr:YihY/virulence factor BrkB family protein [Chitinasiproducens palmae]SDV47712.1 membrane protein [Chitinasiproducens palmae]
MEAPLPEPLSGAADEARSAGRSHPAAAPMPPRRFVYRGRGPMQWAWRIAEPVQRWSDNECPSRAAAIAFYAAFSLAPTLVIIVAVASFFYGAEAAQGRLIAEARGMIGTDAAAGLQAMLANAWRTRMATGVTLISLAGIVIGASATFASLNSALNRIWPLEDAGYKPGIFGMVRVRLISFGLVIGIGFLIVVLLLLDAAVNILGRWFLGEDAVSLLVANVIQRTVSFAMLFLAFSTLLKLLPDAPMRWRSAFTGGVAAALLFSIGKHLFAVYLSSAGTATTFGAAGSLAVILMWLYFSAAVFLLGAEISAANARHATAAAQRAASRSTGAATP